jgi:hypothetical protein
MQQDGAKFRPAVARNSEEPVQRDIASRICQVADDNRQQGG